MVDPRESDTYTSCIRPTSSGDVLRPVIVHVNLTDENFNRKIFASNYI